MPAETIEDHLTWLRRWRHVADRTITERRRVLWHAHRHLPDGLLRASDHEIAAYLDNPKWTSAWTSHCYDSALRVFFSWAVGDRRQDLDPMAYLPKPPAGPREPRPWTDDEIATILAGAPAMPWRRAAMLAVYAGLRCCEIATVTRADIIRDRLRVVGKGGRVRTVPIADDLAAELDDGRPGHLCVGARGRPIQARSLSQLQLPVWQSLGLAGDVHLHGGRHAFATRLLETGADVRVIQQLMGHASLNTTAGYMRVADRRAVEAVGRLSWVPVRGGL